MKTTGSVGKKRLKKLPQMSNRSGHVAMERNGFGLGEVAEPEAK
jgi:hypothetical protein